jgi:predicted lipid-binding transport protein (Tim44 family)
LKLYGNVKKLMNKLISKSRRVSDQLRKLEKTDPKWSGFALYSFIREAFLEIQAMWYTKDLTGLKARLTPNLFREWIEQIQELSLEGQLNRLKDISIVKVELVDLRKTKKKNSISFTARLEVSAVGRTYDHAGSRTEKRLENFQEFWTFQDIEGSWRLAHTAQGNEWKKFVKA